LATTPLPTPGFKVDQVKFLESRIVSFQMENQLSAADQKRLTGFDYSITSGQDVDLSKKIIRVRIGASIRATLKGDTDKKLVGEIKTETVFQIKELAKLMVKHPDGALSLPDQIGGTVLGLAYSTTRGMVLALSAGTCLGKAFLPVINPVRLLQAAKVEVTA